MSVAATQSAVRRAKLSEEHDPVTLCIPFEASPPCLEVLTNWQQTQIPLYHSAFNRLLDQASAAGEISLPKRRIKPLPFKKPRTSLFKRLRTLTTRFRRFSPKRRSKKQPHPDSEIILGAMKRAEGLFKSWSSKRHLVRPPVFGG